MNLDLEIKHLNGNTIPDEKPEGVGIDTLEVQCDGDAQMVLNKCKDVLNIVLKYSESDWPTDNEWKSILPAWFVSGCAEEMSKDEWEKWLIWWRSLPFPEQAQADKEMKWSVSDWIHWLRPPERTWYWWKAIVINADNLSIQVQVDDCPAPKGALEWLLLCAGAKAVEHDE